LLNYPGVMTKLDTPDLCARLDTMKALCDRLEAAQDEPRKYRELAERIRAEAGAICDMVCGADAAVEKAAGER